MADTIQFKKDTASNWNSINPILASGEVGFETNEDGESTRFKIGDGSTEWISLKNWAILDLIILILEANNG